MNDNEREKTVLLRSEEESKKQRILLASTSFEIAQNWKEPLSRDEVENVFKKIALSYRLLLYGQDNGGGVSDSEQFLQETGAFELLRSSGAFVSLRHKNFGFIVVELGKVLESCGIADSDEIETDIGLTPGFSVDEGEEVMFGHFLSAIGEIRTKADLLGMENLPFFELVGNGFAAEYKLTQDTVCSWLLDYNQ